MCLVQSVDIPGKDVSFLGSRKMLLNMGFLGKQPDWASASCVSYMDCTNSEKEEKRNTSFTYKKVLRSRLL